jgi:hypothetical protein
LSQKSSLEPAEDASSPEKFRHQNSEKLLQVKNSFQGKQTLPKSQGPKSSLPLKAIAHRCRRLGMKALN